ncbi:hypothetical protein F4778DRAFT_519734 [Xylariomycetidae sp. FL2044]|nr:hypothetical protein F4778DRAFT_519734 [Xylariomycetidae sp. FL2044]
MSPIAQTTAITVPRGGARSSIASPANGPPSRSQGPQKSHFRHINDLVSVSVDIDPHTPLRKLLETGHAHMRQAITYNEFRRPDLALQEYLRAFTIAVDKVPKHKDYPSLRSDRGDLGRLYGALKTKITNNGATFDQIKEQIKEDNRRSGVQPTASSPAVTGLAALNLPSVPTNEPSRAAVTPNVGSPREGIVGVESSRADTNSAMDDHGVDHISSQQRRSKPVVSPKPQALQSNPVQRSSTSSQDLASRFAKLRDGPKSAGSMNGNTSVNTANRASANIAHRPAVSTTAMPPMPKLPDAIYSPARGTVTSEVANLPSSTPRGMFSRTNSMASAPSLSARTSMENAIKACGRDQFVTAHTFGDTGPSSQGAVTIPAGDTITTQELLDYMRLGSAKFQILLIDIRDRVSFDEGHITSFRTICIDPGVTLRETPSADDIADRMVLAPSEERLAFEQRDKFDLVVVYDEGSKTLPSRITASSDEMALHNIWQALTHYNYSRPLKTPPKLLAGGLDAWVDKLGPQALGTSNSSSDIAPGSRPSTWGQRRKRQRATTRVLTEEQIENFKDELRLTPEAINENYLRSKEDFLRQFPSVSRIPESMSYTGQLSGGDFMETMPDSPPKRPKPSLPRTRYSGLESKDEASFGGMAKAVAPASPDPQIVRTGLLNPHNWCYANSVIQVLLGSPRFMDEFLDRRWPTNYRPNPRPGAPNPQLMARYLANVLGFLNQKQIKTIKLETLMKYLYSIHAGDGQGSRFGDTRQHDVDELIVFIFDQIRDETLSPSSIRAIPRHGNGFVQECIQHWTQWASESWSLIDQYWSCLRLMRRTCSVCNRESFSHVSDRTDKIQFPVESNGQDVMNNLGKHHFTPEFMDVRCEDCVKANREQQQQLCYSRLVRFPPLLRCQLIRGQLDGRKNTFRITPPVDNVDFGQFGLSREERQEIRSALNEFDQETGRDGTQIPISDGIDGETRYDLYAIIIHRGPNANVGHYWAWVRESKDTWIKCEDAETKRYTTKDSEFINMLNNRALLSPDTTHTDYFYKRKDMAPSFC